MKVKICGITSLREVEMINELKPDYMGLVFTKSKRQVTKEEAKILNNIVNKDIKVIGVFKDDSREFIEEVLNYVDLDGIQFHGNEDAEFINYFRKFKNVKLIKALSISSKEDVKKAEDFRVDIIIFDGKDPGSGKAFNWNFINNFNKKCEVLIAGGINKDNAFKAVKISKADGIDVSSAVESIKDGIRQKDYLKMKRLIEKVR